MDETTAKHILCVEDDEVNLDILTKILKRLGHQTTVAVDGSAALQAAKEHLPDLIIMDFHLPGISGVDVTRALRSDEATQHIPIIGLTADIYAREAFMEAGATDYMNKPIRKGTLKRHLEAILRAE